MNVPTIEMPQEAARAAFLEYRHSVRSAKQSALNTEDALIARSYKALAEGKQVVDIEEAFAGAGYDELGLPRLAIARADQKVVAVASVYGPLSGVWERRLELGPARMINVGRRSNAAIDGLVFRFPVKEGHEYSHRSVMRQAIVPNIPPHLRPPFDLKNYHLLWEPKWLIVPRPPGDPLLLKHLGGSLYAVLAMWDLTAVEQAVLSQTRGVGA